MDPFFHLCLSLSHCPVSSLEIKPAVTPHSASPT